MHGEGEIRIRTFSMYPILRGRGGNRLLILGNCYAGNGTLKIMTGCSGGDGGCVCVCVWGGRCHKISLEHARIIMWHKTKFPLSIPGQSLLDFVLKCNVHGVDNIKKIAHKIWLNKWLQCDSNPKLYNDKIHASECYAQTTDPRAVSSW